MTETNTLAGRPIQGEVSHYSERRVAEQYDEARFIEMLDAILAADPRVTRIQWSQYTPYFNDGDACTFSAYVYDEILLSDNPNATWDAYEERWVNEDDEELESVSQYSLRPAGDYGYDDQGKWRYITTEEPSALYTAYEAFDRAVGGGHFDNLLLEHFGDPAEVTATREGFVREHYDHD